MTAPENNESSHEPGIADSINRVWDWSKQGKKPERIGRDAFPMYADDPLAAAHKELDEYLTQNSHQGGLGIFLRSFDPKDCPAGVSLLSQPDGKKVVALRAIVVRVLFRKRQEAERTKGLSIQARMMDQMQLVRRIAMAARGGKPEDRVMDPEEFSSLASELLRTDIPFSEADLISFMEITTGQSGNAFYQSLSNEVVLRAIERHAGRFSSSPTLQKKLREWQGKLSEERASSPGRKLLNRINTLLGKGDNPGIVAGEAWSNAALEDLKQMSAELRAHWCKLLQHCQLAETPKPTQKWTKAANQLLEPIGREEFKSRLLRWFDLVALPRPVHKEPRSNYDPEPDQIIDDMNSVILKGLVWCCAKWDDTDVIRAISRLAQVCFKKVRLLGPRCPRVGNACLYSLSVTTTETAAAELTRLNQMVKQPSARKLIGKSLDRAAELSGQSREDLEESTVPDYGLDADGRYQQAFGDFTAEFSIAGPDALELSWRKADGKLQKSAPAEVKAQHGPELKALKRTIIDIEKMLPAQRHRIERLLMTGREWDFDTWRKRYLEHHLLAHISRRLIWHFKLGDRTALGTWLDGKLVDIHDRPLDWLASETRVRLWHPIGFPVETVAAWREWLIKHEITQPFKQAHREVYIITDAELQTATYSNRFAAHIVRQHQFAALAKDRGWTYLLQGNFDSHNVPTLRLPQWGLAVEFWVNYPGGNETTSQSGIFLYVATDQVRFVRDTEAAPLADIPAAVFSEVMRDVDLFVGVASIGSDPAWQDNGEINGGRAYWLDFSFGDLSASAKTRKEVLQRLLPKLKIAGQCSFDDKFLVVKGSLRTYKIHLGSANIQMEPNNQYLCIVADRGAAVKGGEVFLPFEGDRTLSVILSKAFLLADDAKIKDPTILSQIKR
ncbi:MAG TPA: DUF4132 domain-containing protein [Pseudomonadales bacterium]|nr:DUF4132 domain-containing protein [Pseudomonadales bacterium]